MPRARRAASSRHRKGTGKSPPAKGKAKSASRKPARRSSGRGRGGARWRRRLGRVFGSLPATLQLMVVIAGLGVLALAVNFTWQVARKPSELFFPVSGALYKTPAETWESYGPLFREHATATMTPDLLAALAQVEGSGNPVVRTYWRLQWSTRPFEIWRPASSAVGMYQFTDGTYDEARRWCIHDHRPVADGPWDDPRSCWFNRLYARVIPSHSVEMASAYLDVKVAGILARRGLAGANLAQRQALAALVHLCGAGAGEAYAARGLRFTPAQRCGDHAAADYVARVAAMQSVFRRLAARAELRQGVD